MLKYTLNLLISDSLAKRSGLLLRASETVRAASSQRFKSKISPSFPPMSSSSSSFLLLLPSTTPSLFHPPRPLFLPLLHVSFSPCHLLRPPPFFSHLVLFYTFTPSPFFSSNLLLLLTLVSVPHRFRFPEAAAGAVRQEAGDPRQGGEDGTALWTHPGPPQGGVTLHRPGAQHAPRAPRRPGEVALTCLRPVFVSRSSPFWTPTASAPPGGWSRCWPASSRTSERHTHTQRRDTKAEQEEKKSIRYCWFALLLIRFLITHPGLTAASRPADG